jgi:nicotinamidase-related amidase
MNRKHASFAPVFLLAIIPIYAVADEAPFKLTLR